jgi:hypothetical protein
MSSTYEPIATTTLGSSQANIEFTSIPATYTDLVIIFNGLGAGSTNNLELQFNGDTSNNYSDTYLSANGSSASSGRESSTKSSILVANNGNPPTSGSAYSLSIINIFNYTNTTTYKTVLSRSNNAGNGLDAIVGLWRNTPAAITSVKVFIKSGVNLASGSSATLYGIKAE